jgi:nucleoside transporter
MDSLRLGSRCRVRTAFFPVDLKHISLAGFHIRYDKLPVSVTAACHWKQGLLGIPEVQCKRLGPGSPNPEETVPVTDEVGADGVSQMFMAGIELQILLLGPVDFRGRNGASTVPLQRPARTGRPGGRISVLLPVLTRGSCVRFAIIRQKDSIVNTTTRLQLSIMMFLQYFVWGAWYVTMATYLSKVGFQGGDIGRAYSAAAWAAIVSPFLVGMIADRFFASQIVLAALHLIGAVLLFFASKVTQPGMFFWVLLAYMLCYMPTLALTNAISFRHMEDPAKQFPGIRVLGTIGWIVAGLVIGFMKIESSSVPMQIAAGVSALLGIYSLALPHTPPQSAGKEASVRQVLGLDALGLMKEPSFAVFAIASFLICIPLSFYYNFTNLFLNESGMVNAAGKMTMGQMSEIFFMIVMPVFFVRLGVKWMLVVGMLAWAARYFLFAYGNNSSLVWMFYLGILLHGICYDFFFVTGQIYIDRKAPPDLRASAQGFLAFLTLGLGMLIGANASGQIVEKYQIKTGTEITGHQWQTIWLVPAAMATVVLLLFAAVFRDKISAVEMRKREVKAQRPGEPKTEVI